MFHKPSALSPVSQVPNTLSTTLWLLALLALTTVIASAQQSSSCHLRELDLCAASFLVLTQAPQGLATSDQEINKQCVHLREADTCLRNYTRRCMTPIQRELVNIASNSSITLLDEYCTKGSKLRSNYLKHAHCLNQVQKKEQKSCLRDLQSSLELLTAPNNNNNNNGAMDSINSKRLQLACCTYKRFEACFGGHLERKCGRETVQFVSGIVQRVTSRLPDTVCRAYRPDTQECKALLPKPGAVPKGSKSNSVVSRLLSAYVGL